GAPGPGGTGWRAGDRGGGAERPGRWGSWTGVGRGRPPAVRLGDIERHAHAGDAELPLEAFQILVDAWPHVRAEDRDHRALVLPYLRPHLVRARDVETWEALRQHLARLRFMGRRPVRVDERDHEGLGALSLDQPRRLAEQFLAVERGVDGTVGQHALGHLAHTVARDQRARAP